MKRLLSISLVFSFLVAMGLPNMHGLMGKQWGQAVSGLAHTAPGAVAQHIQSF